MKNNNEPIAESRENRIYAAASDILVVPDVVRDNMKRLNTQPPKRKRRIDYTKKIMNDPLVFNA